MAQDANSKKDVRIESTKEVDQILKDTVLHEKKDILTELLYTGYYSEEVNIGGKIFELRTLTSAELNYADEYVRKIAQDEDIGQMTASRLTEVAYVAMSILNPFKSANTNDVTKILVYLNSDTFKETYEETFNALKLKPLVIIDTLYNRYMSINRKAMEVLEPPVGMDDGDYLKN